MFSASKTSGPSGYNLTNSLRFRKSASAYLSRTPASATNRKTFTWSGWVKRGEIAVGSNDYELMAVRPSSPSYTLFAIRSATATGSYGIIFEDSASTAVLATSNKFRDTAAWYHFVLAVDTTQATAANRVKIYVNNQQVTSFDTYNTYPTLNSDMLYNTTNPHNIGRDPFDTASQFDGYMDEINFIDGQALTPSSFGSTNATTGVWQPARYTGTYGTNGFYLNFTDIALTSGSNTGLGKDFSGNGNYWNTNNISVTAGTTYDAMIDSPTLTSPTVANYAVLNPLITGNVVAPTNANLTSSVSAGTNAYFSSSGTIAISTGKWYWECSITARDAGAGQWFQFGIVSSTTTYTNNAIGYSGNMSNAYAYYNDGSKAGNGTGTAGYGATFTTGDIIGIAFDADAGTITFYKNNVSQGQAFSGISSSLSWLPIIQTYGSTGATNTSAINFGQRPFSYTPPTGYVSLNTFNLPTSTIVKGNTVMDATLYTGNGSTQTITNASSFKPDFVWIKDRTTAYPNMLFDSVRGASKRLISNTTDTEATEADTQTSFNSNGFSVSTNLVVNRTSDAFVGWQWQAGQGTNTTNTAGTVTSTVSVNATAGFSIVTYTGIGSSPKTVGHGLGVAPKMIILKSRGAAVNWYVWHTSLGATQVIEGLNTTGAASSQITFNNTLPTSSVISLGNNDSNNSGSTYVLYVWAEIAGFSKFGSYTGNFNADGPFIYTGFRPKFVLLKSSGDTGSWNLLDATRNPANVANARLFPNNSNAEATSTFIDFLSNGFKIRTSDSDINYTVTNIYMAFAENPFKNALAR